MLDDFGAHAGGFLMADWFRSWHGAPTDPKWRTIAKRAKVAPSLVVAVAWALMDRASQCDVRGSIEGLDIETLADFMDCETEALERIIAAMREKCVLTDSHFSAWEKRQPIREDGSAERAKAWREERRIEAERQRLEAERQRTQENENPGAATPENADEQDRTLANAKKHRVEQSRLDTEKIAALNARDKASLDQLEHDLRSAAGLERESYPGLLDLSPILGLTDAGFDVRTEILPVIRAKRRKGIRSWSYFVAMVHEARETRLAAASGRSNARDGPGRERPVRGVASALAGIDAFHDSRD